MTDAPKNVLLTAHSEYRGLLTAVARRLRNAGAQVHLYCASDQESGFYLERFADVYTSVTAANILYRAIREPLGPLVDIINRARDHETRLGVTFNALAVSDRHLGRGYSLGGFRHPRSTISEETSYLAMLHGLSETVEFWENEIVGRDIDLVINAGKIPAVIARARGVRYRKLVSSRYKNFHYWAQNEFFENDAFERIYHGKAETFAPTRIESPYNAHVSYRAKFRRDTTLSGTLRAMALQVLRNTYWRIQGFQKGRTYYIGDEVAYLWRRRRDTVKLRAPNTTPLKALEGKRFVYFPLHTEPETSLQMLSPEYMFQLETVAAISRDLPAGVILAVKETYEALGRRPTDFHGQIAEFKNVVMLDMLEYGLEVAQKADLTVTITGSGGFEAAVMGRPVVSFGRHNLYNFLDHVELVCDQAELKPVLKQFLSPDFDRGQAAANGARFLEAVVEGSIDLAAYDTLNPDTVDDATRDTVYEALVRSLDHKVEIEPLVRTS